MSSRNLLTATLFFLLSGSCSKKETVTRIFVTSDVHGMIFPYDLIRDETSDHSLAQVHEYISGQRQNPDTSVLLLDNGDFLQGQPPVYYYNYVDTAGVHLSARVMNYMGYDAGTVGNHDIEAGPNVYGKLRKDLHFPWLAANAVRKGTSIPYFEPYTVLRSGGKRIAVLGLITPGIPHWLPESLWPGMEFRDMVETAGEWVPRILETEHPDFMVGLFHSGTDSTYGVQNGTRLNENASLMVANRVPGFDLIFAGHDHRISSTWILNRQGDSVLVLDPGSNARYVGSVTILFGKHKARIVDDRMIPMAGIEPSPAFEDLFSSDLEKVQQYLGDTITILDDEIRSIDALFGPSALTSLIQSVQMDLSGASISFAAPLSMNEVLEEGPLLVSDMFKLYRYENMLYRMRLTGKEIDGFLEYSAGLWFNTMKNAEDHLLLFSEERTDRLANPYFNFSSAAGIIYTVDVTKPPGSRVEITGFSNGRPFSETENYQVAINSYRGNGGGGHLIRGAGIPEEKIRERITWTSDTELRYALMQYLARSDHYKSTYTSNWTLLPEAWVTPAMRSDRNHFR